MDFSVNVDGVATSVDFTTKLKSKTESDIEVTSFYIQDQIDVNELEIDAWCEGRYI